MLTTSVKLLILLLVCLTSLAQAGDVWFEGYTKQDGTKVEGHYRSSPNNTVKDNFSTYGNINPYTGERGTKKPQDDYYDNYQSHNEDTSYLDQAKSDTINVICSTNNGDNFNIEFSNEKLTVKGKYIAQRVYNSSTVWLVYTNKGYKYRLGAPSNGKMPIKVSNIWDLNTSGTCSAH